MISSSMKEHTSKKKQYNCSKCEHKFAQDSDLNQHEITHRDEKTHTIAPIVITHLRRKSDIKEHETIHYLLRPAIVIIFSIILLNTIFGNCKKIRKKLTSEINTTTNTTTTINWINTQF